MAKQLCDACETRPGTNGIGGALLCRKCYGDISLVVKKKHAAGETVNALEIARSMSRQYRVPEELATLAEARAIEIRKATGQACAWSDVIRQTLEAGLKGKSRN
jgi:hypothetical protein